MNIETSEYKTYLQFHCVFNKFKICTFLFFFYKTKTSFRKIIVSRIWGFHDGKSEDRLSSELFYRRFRYVCLLHYQGDRSNVTEI